MERERRRAPRYPFIADAELVEIESGTKLKARTGDLSIGGCFLETLNPSPEGTQVQVTILQGNTTFTGIGRVVFVFPNLGMGIVFTNSAASQAAVLEAWLAELKLSRDAADSEPPP
jgi:hypothetical protein